MGEISEKKCERNCDVICEKNRENGPRPLTPGETVKLLNSFHSQIRKNGLKINWREAKVSMIISCIIFGFLSIIIMLGSKEDPSMYYRQQALRSLSPLRYEESTRSFQSIRRNPCKA